jgi:hypothetical protein
MYSFDESAEAAQETYSTVCHAYERILRRLRLPVVKGKLKQECFPWKFVAFCHLILSTMLYHPLILF